MNDSRSVTGRAARDADGAARERALDPARSFIVQAPAGSGKTELLIQRYLRLLALVEAPEEIVAITFTRKAAGEMRDRVLQALASAQDETPPAAQHRRHTWQLARAAAARDAQHGWQLAANPNRLRIQTIDSLCLGLTRQMPVLSGFGGEPELIEDARPLYVEAARRTLAQLDQHVAWAPLIARMLAHLDNNAGVAEQLLADMLARRDQWLRHVADRRSPRIERATLEAALAGVVCGALRQLRGGVPADIAEPLLAAARIAAENLASSGRDSEILNCDEIAALPDADPAALSAWLGLAHLVLTREGTLRRAADVRIGFPAASSARSPAEKERLRSCKETFEALLGDIGNHPDFIDRLHAVRLLPAAAYGDDQWKIVEALIGLLPVAVAQLDVLFAERGQVDFTAVSQAAVRALGAEGEPTDLALALDYRIRHLLIDEFQDTSLSQYELLTRLTAGWQPDDGRTLLVVGDPMQSIYRFREADVALYLRARRDGIGQVALEPLTLSVNFRSQQGIVEWVNGAFAQALPAVEDTASGAVPYSPAVAEHALLAQPAVTVHARGDADRTVEAQQVVALVRDAQSENPQQTIAILVRSRGHLADIVPALKAAGLRFQAIEIEALGHRPVVRDLCALTRALLHPADRIAWLAVLRAPWCGLTLADLYALAGRDPDAAVWDLMNDSDTIARLSPDGGTRLQRVRAILDARIAGRRRAPLRCWIEGAWLALGGPACVENAADLDDARAFLEQLDELEEGGDLADFERLAERVAGLYALPDAPAGTRLQIMTIHKAKGLEFDTVILPGLGRAPRHDAARLLLWQERARDDGRHDLLLAPIRAAADAVDPVYRYLAALDKTKGAHEDARLLYVAATRARTRLHLIGHVNAAAKTPAPHPGSLLARLWPAVSAAFEQIASPAPDAPLEPEDTAVPPATVIRRLPAGWCAPQPQDVAWKAPAESSSDEDDLRGGVEFSWASETARHVGTVVHRFLQIIAEDGVVRWDDQRIAIMHEAFARELARLGVPRSERDAAVLRVAVALGESLRHERGRWLLSEHPQAQSELRLTGVLDGALCNVAMDRTFVDDDGVRWIVDYKTGAHEGGDPQAFLDREQERYREQLERYARLMHALDPRPTRLALFFPLLGDWREWPFQ
ncbi:MAG TPA: UvrD-helicase domain-containing protein [Burkholderiales bacterium]|nr:UvrD-helicase domain-containing protein [Burkholderiales bacterium]